MRTAIKVLQVMGGGGVSPAVTLTCTTTGAETLTLERLGAVTGKTIHVDWGDGTSNDYTDNPAAARTHAYAGAGAWKVVISPPTAVVSLDLRDTKLSCTSGQIGQMTGLMNIYMNSLPGITVGAGEIGALTNLTSLYLSSMAGATIGAGEIGGLTNLTYLYLRTIVGATIGAGEIGGLTNLTSLILRTMAGATIGAGEIGGLTNLTYLILSDLAGASHNVGLSTLLKLTTVQIELGLSQAEVDTVLSQLYTAFPTKTAVNGAVDLLGVGNAAPTGVSPGSAECPPSTGWNMAYELVNDSCGIAANHWASVTCQT